MSTITKKVAFKLTNSATIIAAVAGAAIRLVQVNFTVDDAIDVTIEGATSNTDMLPLAAPSTTGWGVATEANHESGIGPDSQVGEGVKITMSGAANLWGAIVYQEIS